MMMWLAATPRSRGRDQSGVKRIHAQERCAATAEKFNHVADSLQRRITRLEPAVEPKVLACEVHELPGVHEQHNGRRQREQPWIAEPTG